MELNEMEKKLLFQVEGDYQTKILNELYMTVRYSNNSEQREAAEGLMAKLRVSPKRENPRQVKPEQAKPKQAEPEQENPAQLNTNPCGSCSGRWRNPTGTGLPKYGRNTGIKRAGKENIRSPLGQTLRDRCGLLFAETGDQLRSHSPVFTSRDFLRSPVSWRTGLCICRER